MSDFDYNERDNSSEKSEPKIKKQRKVVQIALMPCGYAGNTCNDSAIVVLCDDGELFINVANTEPWIKLPPIPQPGEENDKVF